MKIKQNKNTPVTGRVDIPNETNSLSNEIVYDESVPQFTTIVNSERYITSSTLAQCFTRNKHTKVDKVLCGNGFSTAYLTHPVPKGRVNIVIVPNLAVIVGKERDYKSGKLKTQNKIGFIYKEGKDNISNNYDVLMFVVDSFITSTGVRDLYINWILIDEAHSIEIQSSFRPKLKGFERYVSRYLTPHTAVVSVTATPNLFSRVDVVIDNVDVPPTVVNTTRDRNATVDRIIADMKAGLRVFVVTNSAQVIYKLRNKKQEVRARFIIGERLARRVYGLVKVIEDDDAPLVIASTRGFEGFDLLGINYRVYFIEDRNANTEHETFYISNLYQALSRCREGASYIEYSVRVQSDDRPDKVSEEEVDAFIARDGLVERKLNKENSKKFKDFIYTTYEKGDPTIHKDRVAVGLWRERLLYDHSFDNSFKDFSAFLKRRNILILYMNETQTPVAKIKQRQSQKLKTLSMNKDAIIKKGIYRTLRVERANYMEADTFHKAVTDYVMKKRFDVCESDVLNEYGQRALTYREGLGLRLAVEVKAFKALEHLFIRSYKRSQRVKHGHGAEALKNIADFKKKSEYVLRSLIANLMRPYISPEGSPTVHRDYNVFTDIGLEDIKVVTDLFKLSFVEYDIASAYIRIAYSVCGLRLPNDIYGEGKRLKVEVNIALNDFSYQPDYRKRASSRKVQRYNAKVRLDQYNIDPVVVDWLMREYFDIRGKFFHAMSYHEKLIIKDIKEVLDDKNNDGVVRRHDSVIVFNNRDDNSWLNGYQYNNVGGWFQNISGSSDVVKGIIDAKNRSK